MVMREAIVLRDQASGGGIRYEFPVNPSTITVDDGLNTTKVPIIKLGQINLPGPLKVLSLAFETYLPRVYDSSTCNYSPIEDPEVSFRRLQGWMGRRDTGIQAPPTLLRVVITEVSFSREMILTQVNGNYRGLQPDSLYVRVRLEDQVVQQLRIEQGEARALAEEPEPGSDGVPPEVLDVEGVSFVEGEGYELLFGSPPVVTTDRRSEYLTQDITYVTRRGDTLASLAIRHFGESGRGRWLDIYSLNRGKLGEDVLPGANPNYVLEDGITLTVPNQRQAGFR